MVIDISWSECIPQFTCLFLPTPKQSTAVTMASCQEIVLVGESSRFYREKLNWVDMLIACEAAFWRDVWSDALGLICINVVNILEETTQH